MHNFVTEPFNIVTLVVIKCVSYTYISCVCVHMCVHVCTYMCTCVCICMCVCVCVCACVRAHEHVCAAGVCIYSRMCACECGGPCNSIMPIYLIGLIFCNI